MKIKEADYIKGSFLKRVQAITLNKADYLRQYRSYLYCIEPGCNALMSFVEKKKNNLKFFRTWSKSEHKEGCPNEVLYDEDETDIKSEDGHGELINLTDKHIMDKLIRTYEAIGKNEDAFGEKDRENNKNKRAELGGSSILPALFNEGEELPSGRQPYLLTRYFDKIMSEDINQIRCVVGTVHSIQLHEKCGYINLTQKGPDSVKVCFTEAFIKSEKNVTQYPKFMLVKEFYEHNRSSGIPVTCCCVGKLGYAKLGINIYPDRYNGFILNGLSFYDILREMKI